MKPKYCKKIVSLTLSSIFATALMAPAAPQISAESTHYEFGRIKQSEVVQHTFIIKNIGDENLIISKVKTTCGCTVAELSNKTIEPGQHAEIKSKFDSKGKQGKINKVITVENNDPSAENFKLVMKGEVLTEIMLSPTFINFKNMSPGEKRKIKARITIAEDSSAKVIKAEVLQENSGLALELIPLEDGKNYDLWVSSPENLEKSFYYSIKIHTDSKKTPIKHISVNGYVPGPLNIPKSLFFTKRPSETNRVTRSIRIMPGTVKNFTVLDATWPEEDVEVKITHLGESRGSQITFSNIKVSTSLNGKKVTVKTDVPKLEEVNIPLRVNTMPDK